jgi:hypothetical protein
MFQKSVVNQVAEKSMAFWCSIKFKEWWVYGESLIVSLVKKPQMPLNLF